MSDKADYYRRTLECERSTREQLDKEVIDLLHDVKKRYDHKISLFMPKNTETTIPNPPHQATQAKNKAKNKKGKNKSKDEAGQPERVEDNTNSGWGDSGSKGEVGRADESTSWDQANKVEYNSNSGWGDCGNEGDAVKVDESTSWDQPKRVEDNTNSGWGDSGSKGEVGRADESTSWDQANKVEYNSNSGWGDCGNEGDAVKVDKSTSWDQPERVEDNTNSGWGDSEAKTDQVKVDVPTTSNEPDKVDDKEKELADLQYELNLVKKYKDRYQRKFMEASLRNERLESDLAHSRNLISTLKDGCAIVERQLRTYETRHDEVAATKEALEREIIAMKEESSEHITTISKLTSNLKSITEAFVLSTEEHQKCRQELEVLQQEYATRLHHYRMEHIKLRETNSQLNKVLDYMKIKR